MGLSERIDELAARYPKPPRIQDVWDASHDSDYESYRTLQAKDWTNLSVEDIRSFGADVSVLNKVAWQAFLPALMRQSLIYPYLTHEYDGTLVTEVVALLSDEQTGSGRNLRDAIRGYAKEHRDVVRDWLRWFAEQTPDLTKRSEWEASVYRKGREEDVRRALAAIEG